MFGLFLIGVVVLGVAIGVLGDLRARPRPARIASPHSPLGQYEHRSTIARAGAILLGLIAAGLATQLDPLGRGVLLAPSVFAIVVLVVIAIAESMITRRLDGAPEATLDVRTPSDYWPRGLARVVIGCAAALAVVLIITSVTAGTDDLGRAGRQISWTCGPDADGSAGPYPGTFYSIPATLGIALVLAIWLVAARFATHRRRLSVGEGDLVDAEIRSRTLTAMTAAAATGLAAMLAGTALITGFVLVNAALSPATCRAPTSFAVGGWTLVAVAAIAGVLTGWSATRLITPRGDRSRATRRSERNVSI